MYISTNEVLPTLIGLLMAVKAVELYQHFCKNGADCKDKVTVFLITCIILSGMWAWDDEHHNDFVLQFTEITFLIGIAIFYAYNWYQKIKHQKFFITICTNIKDILFGIWTILGIIILVAITISIFSALVYRPIITSTVCGVIIILVWAETIQEKERKRILEYQEQHPIKPLLPKSIRDEKVRQQYREDWNAKFGQGTKQ